MNTVSIYACSLQTAFIFAQTPIRKVCATDVGMWQKRRGHHVLQCLRDNRSREEHLVKRILNGHIGSKAVSGSLRSQEIKESVEHTEFAG